MIVLLLNCFTSLLQANDEIVPSTGKLIQTDTVAAIVPINIIRKANIKLNERLILKNIVYNQNLEIDNLKELNSLNDSTINYYRNGVITQQQINQSINYELAKQRDTNRKLKGICIGTISISIVAVLFLIIK